MLKRDCYPEGDPTLGQDFYVDFRNACGHEAHAPAPSLLAIA